MKSRMDKYNNSNNNLSRSSKNQSLYDDIYTNTNYNNMVVIDDSNEIDINKIKEIIDREKNQTRTDKRPKLSDNLYDDVPTTENNYPNKVYDINKVLKDAKDKRDIIEEANEKRKREHFEFKNNEELEKELAKTRKVYQSLIKEEKELLNIMNTLTNVSSTDIAMDLFEDLTQNGKTEVIEPINNKTESVNIKQITDEDSREYSTDTFMFNTKDFESIENMKNEVKKTNVFIQILIFLLTTVIVCAAIFVITKYFIK